MRATPPAKKREALGLLQNGHSTREIATITGISQRSVSNIIQDNKENVPHNVGGRPRKLSIEAAEYAKLMIKCGRAKTAVDATKKLNRVLPAPVSARTVRRGLRDVGMGAEKVKRRPALKKIHTKERKLFAMKYREWTVGDWARVIFSDESKINRISSDGLLYRWVDREETSDRAVQGTVKFGGGGVKVWACFSWYGPGYITMIDDTMDAALYKQILQEELHESLDEWNLGHGDFVFQHDRDPKHTARIVHEYLESIHLTEEEGTLLMWPAQSPDLNPIEHMWAELKRRLAAYPEYPKNCRELWERIGREWYAIPRAFCQKLIKSMPHRLAAVYRARGRTTRY